MLETVVVNVLNRVLGDYVANLETSQLNVGIWQGDIKLHNLNLKRDALDRFNLPIVVHSGFIGHLTLKIPWTNLKGSPVSVNIRDIFLLAGPRPVDEVYDAEAEAQRLQKQKMHKLETAEHFSALRRDDGIPQQQQQQQLTAEAQRQQQANETLVTQLVTKIVDNLQISIHNIHIRYEDESSSPGHPFAVGVTLEELSAVSTDANWQQTFIHDALAPIHKLLELRSLAIYWNPDARLLTNYSNAAVASMAGDGVGNIVGELNRVMVELIANEQSVPAEHSFVLLPVSGKGKLVLNKRNVKVPPGTARSSAMFEFDQLAFAVDDQQYQDALQLVASFDAMIRRQRYIRFRPSPGVRPSDDPIAWLQFAFRAVHYEVSERRRRWTWAALRERRDDRIEYIRLYVDRETLGADFKEVEKLAAMERKLSFQDIRQYRSRAVKDLRRKRDDLARRAAEQQKQKQEQTWSSWAASWIYDSGQPSQSEHSEKDLSSDNTIGSGGELNLTEEQRRELYEAIEYDEKHPPVEFDVPEDAMLLSVSAKLNSGSLTLKYKSKFNGNGGKEEKEDDDDSSVGENESIISSIDADASRETLVSIVFDKLFGSLVKYPKNSETKVELGSLQVVDGTTPNTRFPLLVQVQGDEMSNTTGSNNGNDSNSNFASGSELKSFFELTFEDKPKDGRADAALSLKTRGLNVVYSPDLLHTVRRLFAPPTPAMESLNSLMNAAGRGVENLTRQTRAGLQHALDEHKTLDLNVDITAPVFLFPESLTAAETPTLVLDSGHLTVTSKLISRNATEAVRRTIGRTLDSAEFAQLEELMYDEFALSLSDVQLVAGRSAPSCLTALRKNSDNDNDRPLHILDRVNLDFAVWNCILPRSVASDLTRMKINGHLSNLALNMSDFKYKTMMSAIDRVMLAISGNKNALDTQSTLSQQQQQQQQQSSRTPTATATTAAENTVNKTLHEHQSGNKNTAQHPIFTNSDHLDDLVAQAIEAQSDTVISDADENENENDQTQKDDGGELFYDAVTEGGQPNSKSGKEAESEQLMSRVGILFEFKVDRASASIQLTNYTDLEQPDTKLGIMHVDGLNVIFTDKPFDMEVKVVVQKVSIEDLVSPPLSDGTRRDILSSDYSIHSDIGSNNNNTDGTDNTNRELVRIIYHRVQPSSPEFYTRFSGLRQSVDIDFSSVTLNISPHSILTLYDAILKTFVASADPSREYRMRLQAADNEANLYHSTHNSYNYNYNSKLAEIAAVVGPTPSSPRSMSFNLQATPSGKRSRRASNVSSSMNDPDDILVKLKMAGIELVLIEEHVPLATFSVRHAQASVLVRDTTMRVSARIGDMMLVDQVTRVPGHIPDFTTLLSIADGADMADLEYETFDSTDFNYPGYDASVRLKVAATQITFVEDTLKDLMRFGKHFSELYFLYEVARQKAANAAWQQIETVKRWHYSIDMDAPLVAFPQQLNKRDVIVANLGRFSMINKLDTINDINGVQLTLNCIHLTLTQINLRSLFYFSENNSTLNETEQILEILDNVDLEANVEMCDHLKGSTRTATSMEAKLSDITMKLTEKQYKAVLGVANTLNATFFGSPPQQQQQQQQQKETLSPTSLIAIPSMDEPEWYSFFMHLVADHISLELFAGDGTQSLNLNDASFCRMVLESNDFTFRSAQPAQTSDAELATCSLFIRDTRVATDNKFRDLFTAEHHSLNMPHASTTSTSTSAQQPEITSYSFPQAIVRYSMDGSPAKRPPRVIVTVDTPHVVLVLDHIFALRDYFMSPFVVQQPSDTTATNSQSQPTPDGQQHQPQSQPQSQSQSQSQSQPQQQPQPQPQQPGMLYDLKIVQPTFTLLAHPENEATEAVVLCMNRAIIRQSSEFMANLDGVSFSLCTMDDKDATRISIMDPISLAYSQQSRVTPSDFNTAMTHLREMGQLGNNDNDTENDAMGADMASLAPTVESTITDIDVAAGKIVMRLSMRDVHLINSIIQKAAELSAKSAFPIQSLSAVNNTQDGSSNKQSAATTAQSQSTNTANSISNNTNSNNATSPPSSRNIMKGALRRLVRVIRETARIDSQGVRVLLIGDTLDAPLVDVNIEPFQMSATDWSSRMNLESQLTMAANYFNLTNSQWEPLIEPWKFVVQYTTIGGSNRHNSNNSGGGGSSIGGNNDESSSNTLVRSLTTTKVDVSSRQRLDINVSHAAIAGLLATSHMFTSAEPLSKPRGNHVPYILRNRTGLTMSIWSRSRRSTAAGTKSSAKQNSTGGGGGGNGGSGVDIMQPVELIDGSDINWRFEDWRQTRNSTSVSRNLLDLIFHDTTWETLRDVNVERAGTHLYTLRPRLNDVAYKLAVDIKLKNHVKIVTFRSSLVVENSTLIDLQVIAVDSRGQMVSDNPATISPGESYAVPLPVCYHYPLRIRPLPGIGYEWCGRAIFWRQFSNSNDNDGSNSQQYQSPPPMTVTCPARDRNRASFIVLATARSHAQQNNQQQSGSSSPLILTNDYPAMTIRISPPIEIENLLPCDCTYILSDLTENREWSNSLRRGAVSPVHVVAPGSVLKIRLKIPGTNYMESESTIINSRYDDEIKDTISLSDQNGYVLTLHIARSERSETGGALRFHIYSPYILLNRTGLNIQYKARSLVRGAMLAAGQSPHNNGSSSSITNNRSTPFMFSYGSNEPRNRALVKVGHSGWSRPLSFEAVGTNYEVAIESIDPSAPHEEIYLGVSVEQGTGKFKKSRVVTFLPRYMVKNNTNLDLYFRDVGSHNAIHLAAGKIGALHFVHSGKNREITFGKSATGARWSAPVIASNVGKTHVRLPLSDRESILLRIEVVINKASLSIIVSREDGNKWPYKIENISGVEVFVRQYDPDSRDANLINQYDSSYPGGSGGNNSYSNSNHQHLHANDAMFPMYKLQNKISMNYAWDMPSVDPKALVLTVRGKERLVLLREIGQQEPFRYSSSSSSASRTVSSRYAGVMSIDVIAEGATQVLRLTPYNPHASIFRPLSTAATDTALPRTQLATSHSSEVSDNNAGSAGSAGRFEAVSDSSSSASSLSSIVFRLRLEGIGVSVIDQNLQELIYLTLRGIEFKYSDSSSNQAINLIVQWIQIDNQLFGSLNPIILYPTDVAPRGFNSSASMSSTATTTTTTSTSGGGGAFSDGRGSGAADGGICPTLHLSLVRAKDSSYGVDYIKYFSILIQELSIGLDEDFLFALLNFLKFDDIEGWNSNQSDNSNDSNGNQVSEIDEILLALNGSISDWSEFPEPIPAQDARQVYFDTLHVQPVKLNISFNRSIIINRITGGNNGSSRSNQETVSLFGNGLLGFIANTLTMAIGNIDMAPVRLNSLAMSNVYATLPDLLDRFTTHYRQEVLLQVHKLIGSVEVLGNPVGLFNSIAGGVADFFYEPYQGFVMSDRPQDFGIGLARGTASLFKKTVFGFAGSFSKFTDSMGKGLSVATFDKDFQEQRRIERVRNRPKHALSGLTQGTASLATSVASGIAGVVTQPIEGGRREGMAGFMRGVGAGLVGAVTKPVVGLLDFAGNFAEGIRNTTTVFENNEIDRVRLPRFIGRDGIITPYGAREALGQSWLKEMSNNKYIHEDYIAHLELRGSEMVVLLTCNLLIMFSTRGLKVVWEVALRDLHSVVLEKTGIVLKLQNESSPPFIPIPMASSRRFFFQKIEGAVRDLLARPDDD